MAQVTYLSPQSQSQNLSSQKIMRLKWLNENEIIIGGLEHQLRVFDPEHDEVKAQLATAHEAITALDS